MFSAPPQVNTDDATLHAFAAEKVSIGVMAYNEAANIGALLDALLAQENGKQFIREIIVVSSGSIDATESIVRQYIERDDRIKLLVQKERLGKASAVNLFLSISKSDILVLQSADTIPLPQTLSALLAPFCDPQVGMTGGQPLPDETLTGAVPFGVSFMWKCHHLRNLERPEYPKLGELIAFRKVFTEIYSKTAVDEAEIEALIHREGLRRVYCPAALVLNGGPARLREFARQRFRVHLGNIDLCRRTGYRPLHGYWFKLCRWGLKSAGASPRKLSSLFVVGCCEVATLFAAKLRMLYQPEPPYIWKTIASGKQPELPPASQLSQL